MTRKTARRYLPLAVLVPLVLAGCTSGFGPDNDQNTLRPDGPAAQDILNLFVPWFWVAVVIGVGVLIATFYVALRFRDKGDGRRPKQVHGHTALEITWTVIPALILAVLGVFTVQLIWKLAAAPASDAVKVTATGKQWWWQFTVETPEYTLVGADGKETVANQIVTSGELHIPVGREIDINVVGCDAPVDELGPNYDEAQYNNNNPCNVIHSFWIPALNGKADAVPGRNHRLVIKADRPGTYLGQCAEYCGLSHANMRMRVIAQTPEDYATWVKGQQQGPVKPFAGPDGNAVNEPGPQLIAEFGCTNCHIFDDPSKVNYAPNLTHLASRTTIAGATYSIVDDQGQIAGIGYEHLWRWIHDATDEKWGIPMQATDCRFPTGTCVGMPNYSIEQSQTVDGETTVYRAMTEQEAQIIADYLKGQK